jgi:hypothetical protein
MAMRHTHPCECRPKPLGYAQNSDLPERPLSLHIPVIPEFAHPCAQAVRHPCRSFCILAHSSPSGGSAAKYYALRCARLQGYASPAAPLRYATALAPVLTAGGVFFMPPPLPPGGAVRGCPCRPCGPLPAALPPLLRRWAAAPGLFSSFSVGGCVMAGFVSVLSSRGAGVVARPLSCGWVWARRALPCGAGWSPAPACLFVPFGSFALAAVFARGVSALGWRAWVRPGSAGSAVWSACGLPVPAFAVKVALPSGLSCRAACAALPPMPALSSLGALGV